MRTRSQTLAAQSKIHKDENDFEQVDQASKRRKTRKTVPSEVHAQSLTTEKRLHGYRSKPTNAIRVRIQRALKQRLYLLAVSSAPAEATHREYRVFGQTGNVYTVTITHLPSCTCPDYDNGFLCKHIIFVLHRVLKVDRHSPLLHQKALLTAELKEIFAKADAQRDGTLNDSTILAEYKVREAYRTATGDPDTICEGKVDDATTTTAATSSIVQQKPITEDDDCPICFESMEDGKNDSKDILFCSTSCGNNMHASCFNKWRRAKVLMSESVTCPFCRVEWKTEVIDASISHDPVYDNTGYLNLAAHATAMANHANDDRRFYYSYPRYYSNYWRRRRRRRD